jgi:hypothetical protein
LTAHRHAPQFRRVVAGRPCLSTQFCPPSGCQPSDTGLTLTRGTAPAPINHHEHYRPPKQRLHKNFLYLDHDSVLNSLSALEAGRVDSIIQNVVDAREGGLEATLGAGPVRGGGGRKKSASVEEQLVRTRTRFSAFEAWHSYLKSSDAIGTFDVWGQPVRDALSIGDTLEFAAELQLSPVHKLFRSYLAFAADAAKPGNQFSQKGAELQQTKELARTMVGWMGGRDKPTHLSMYALPGGVAQQRILTGMK